MNCFKPLIGNPVLLLLLTLLLGSGRCSNDDGIIVPNDPMDQQSDDMGDDSDEPSGDDANTGTFTTATSITPSGIEEGFFFGYDIAATSEFTAASAPRHDEKGNRTGAVYIFRRNGSEFELTAETLFPENATTEDHFGWSVALDGTILVVGAPENDKNGENSGLAFIYEHIGNNQWNLIKELEAPNPQEGQEFGHDVAIDHGLIVVSSKFDTDNYYDDGPLTNGAGFAQGSVFVYEQASNWEFTEKLIPQEEEGHRWDAYGTSLALHGNYLAVGAPGASDLLYEQPGSVYVFDKEGDVWVQQARIEASDGSDADSFGSALAFEGNDLAITAPGSFNSLTPNSDVPHGAAYVFTKTGSDWTEDAKLIAVDTKPEDGYGGGDIALQENYLIVGAPLKRIVTDNNGTVYFFKREPGWPESHLIAAPNPLNEDLFGSALAVTTDMIFVGAHRRCNETGCWAGALYFVE